MPLTDNLIVYCTLNEASGTRSDSHGSNSLSETGSVGSGTGNLNGSATFNGSIANYLSHTDNADLSTGDIDFTVQIGVKLNATLSTYYVLAHKGWAGASNSNREWVIWYDSNADRFVFSVEGSGGVVTSNYANNFGAPSAGVWYLIHAWHDSVNNQTGISVNAGTPNTASHSAGVNDGILDLVLGASVSQTLSLNGELDEFGFWKRVLSSQDRTDLHNGGAWLPYPFATGGTIRRRYARGAQISLVADQGSKVGRENRGDFHSVGDITTLPLPMADRNAKINQGDIHSFHPDAANGHHRRSVSLETSLISPIHAKHRFARGDTRLYPSSLDITIGDKRRAPIVDTPAAPNQAIRRFARGDTRSLQAEVDHGRTHRGWTPETPAAAPTMARRRFARGDTYSQGSDIPIGYHSRGRAIFGELPELAPFIGPRRKSRKQFRRTIPSGEVGPSLITPVHAARRGPNGDVATQGADYPTGGAKRAANPGNEQPDFVPFVGPRRKSRRQYRRTLHPPGEALAEARTAERRVASGLAGDICFWFHGKTSRRPTPPGSLEGSRSHRDVRPIPFPIFNGKTRRSLPQDQDAVQDPIQKRRFVRAEHIPFLEIAPAPRRAVTREEDNAPSSNRPVRIKLRRPGVEMLPIAPHRRRPLIRPPEDPVFIRRRPKMFEWIAPFLYDTAKPVRGYNYLTGEDAEPDPCPERPIFTESEDAQAALVEESGQLLLVASDSGLPGRIDDEDSRPIFPNECR